MATTPFIKTVQDSNGNTIKIGAVIPLYTKSKKDGDDYWIVYSPHFKTFGYSKESEDLAVKDLRKALDAFFNIHSKRGTLEKALIEFKWKKKDDIFIQPKLGNIPSLSKSPSRELRLAYA